MLTEAIATFVLVFVGAAIVEKEIGRGFVAPIGGALVWGIGPLLGATLAAMLVKAVMLPTP